MIWQYNVKDVLEILNDNKKQGTMKKNEEIKHRTMEVVYVPELLDQL
jgi:hypothetical protein